MFRLFDVTFPNTTKSLKSFFLSKIGILYIYLFLFVFQLKNKVNFEKQPIEYTNYVRCPTRNHLSC